MDVKIWLVFFFNIAINIPNGGLQTFGTIIIADLGFSSLNASLLTMPFGILATSSAWFFSFIASRWHNRRTIVACIALLLPLFGTSLVYGLPRSNIAGQMIGLYFMYFYWRKSSLYLPRPCDHVKLSVPCTTSTIHRGDLSSAGQHCRPDKEVCSFQPGHDWVRCWEPRGTADVHRRSSTQVHWWCRRHAHLLLCCHVIVTSLLRCSRFTEQGKGQEIRQARRTSRRGRGLCRCHGQEATEL